jgi:hypothetical protein
MTGSKCTQRFPILFLVLLPATILFSQVPASAQVLQFDSLGTVTAKTIACPSQGLPATACYALDVSCPSISNYTVYLKTFVPASPPRGVVTLTPGGTSTQLFEEYAYGSVTVQDLLSARFLAVEITFGAPFDDNEKGWQTNVNGAGPRAASCRYATVTQWIKNKLASQVPLCAAGLSASSQQIAEGLAHYGLSQYLAFAELGSGPPFTRTDEACIPSHNQSVEYCSGIDVGMDVGVANAQNYIDPAYPGPWCSEDIETGSNLHQAQFLSDSITSPDALLNYPSTTVWFLYGGLDNSSAINQGESYRLNIKTANHAGCVPGAPHSLASVVSGAQQIANDMSVQCRFPKHH